MRPELSTADALNAWSPGSLVELLGITIVSVEEGRLTSELVVASRRRSSSWLIEASFSM